MLITRPDHDITTSYLYYWSKPLIEAAKRAGKRVFDLSKKRANRKEFASVVRKTQPQFIVFNGHGDEKTVTGYDNEPLVGTTLNLETLENKIVYARACASARRLGKKSVKNGCRAYIGYDDDFVFMIEDDKITKPSQDKTALLFLEPANQVVVSILKGHSVSEASQKSRKKYQKNIQKLMVSSATKEEKDLIPYLVWNYSHQVNLGDLTANLL